MKKLFGVLLVAVALAGCFKLVRNTTRESALRWRQSAQQQQQQPEQINVYYCREDACDKQIADQLLAAKTYAYFCIYTITKDSIVDALIAAKLRGVDVRGVIDYGQSLIDQEKPKISRLKKYGISLRSLYKEQGIMHIKMLVTEQAYVSGSFNWTVSATSLNDEVLEVGSTENIRKQYEKIFWDVWGRYKDL